ncbi:aspartyl protease AED3 [Punica granatum]|uniref:Peptidase A1 domain-containing protein n=2 Tax=Punica granatum TaxID=22663 RepID=A0A218W4M9_PUNGR|nr:aspartyl protease AED3 [Punica granatum]OWM67725.1 hypothetical protein CDL15_Pgr019226 [Punica granatum]PKI73536.1 hypothetical protein CRG98_006117 [Punica granatum]
MDMPTKALLFFALLISCTQAADPCATQSDLSIIHVYGKCSPFDPPKPEPNWVNTVLNMAAKDPARLRYLSSLVAQKVVSVPIAPGQQVLGIGNYVVRVKLGTPGQTMYMVLDNSYDATWAPCAGCTGCSSTMFSPNSSTSYSSLDCSLPQCTQVQGLQCPATGAGACFFNRSYGGDSSLAATLVKDSLTLGKDAVSNYAFGCITAISGRSIPPEGLLGLGRGPMSLLSQTGSLYSGVFSYCLPSFRSYYFSGSLKLGPASQPKRIQTTPLLKNPHRPSLYYVNLTGISVGRVLVPIDPKFLAFNPTTGAGTIIDSGTVITRFVQPIYTAVRDEFRKQVQGPFSSLGAFDTCFTATNEAAAPIIAFHFQGLDLKLPLENSLIHSSAGSLACLAMAAAPNNVNSVLNVIANLQQQNLRVMFDTANSQIGIARELCN